MLNTNNPKVKHLEKLWVNRSREIMRQKQGRGEDKCYDLQHVQPKKTWAPYHHNEDCHIATFANRLIPLVLQQLRKVAARLVQASSFCLKPTERTFE